MKKFTLLVLTLVAVMFSNSAWAAYDVTLTRDTDLRAMEEGESKTILIAAPSTSSPGGVKATGYGYFLGSSGTGFDFSVSYTEDGGTTNNSVKAANTRSCLWTITKKANDTFTIQDQDGNYLMHNNSSSPGVGTTEETWEIGESATMPVNFCDTYLDIIQDVNDVVRFINPNASFLNQNGPRFASGTGGWSYWLVLEVTGDTYTVITDPENIGGITLPDYGITVTNGQTAGFASLPYEGVDFEVIEVSGYVAGEAVVSEEAKTISITYTSEGVVYLVHVTGVDAEEGGIHLIADDEDIHGEEDFMFEGLPVEGQDFEVIEVDGFLGTATIDGTDINVVYKKDWEKFWTGQYITEIGEEITELSPSEEQWYVVKQSRGGETPMFEYKAYGTIYRTSVGSDVNVGDEAVNDRTALVRFVRSEIESDTVVYNIQFGTGRYIGDTPVSSDTPGNYFVYPSVQENEDFTGHFAITHTSDGVTYEERLDNNGAGSTVAFWSSGYMESGTNAVWALYPVTFGGKPTVTYDITIVGDPTGEATITLAGVDGIFKNGDQVTCPVVKEEEVVATTVEGYTAIVNVGDGLIYVTYIVSGIETFDNSTVFNLVSPRGTLHYNRDSENQINSQVEGVAENAYDWAFVKGTSGKTYLYNVGADAFLSAYGQNAYTLSYYPASEVTVGDTENETYPMYFQIGDLYLNLNTDSVLVTTTTITVGTANMFHVVYSAAADLTDAINRIAEKESKADITALNTALETAQAIHDLLGDGVSQYTETNDGDLFAAIVAAMDYGEDTPVEQQAEVDQATAALNAAIEGAKLNLPKAGDMFRIKGTTTGKYISTAFANNGLYAMNYDNESYATVFVYTSAGRLMNYESGQFNGMDKTKWEWLDEEEAASEVTFGDGGVIGAYWILSKNAYFVDSGDNPQSSADRGAQYDAESVRYNGWILEAFSEDDPDAIIEVAPSTGSGTSSIYDLTGRKVQLGQLGQSGLYIIGGKKVMY